MKAKIIGAGSVGNHLSQSARRIGWDVCVVDKDPEALRRMREDIYPTRYGAWDKNIQLCTPEQVPIGGFDVVFIGTPPDAHLPVAISVLKNEAPRVLQIEKPLSATTLKHLSEFTEAAREHKNTKIVVGYDHVLGDNTVLVEKLLKDKRVGDILTLDAETRSHWSGVLKAHPWLSGPQDTYLGFWERGGGASGEHSHALNLWQHFAHYVGAGRVASVQGMFDYVRDGNAWYDRICFLNLVTEKGLTGRVVQDVVTNPKRKLAVLQGDKGRIEWACDVTKTLDQVSVLPSQGSPEVTDIAKTRPDEFFKEIQHIAGLLDGSIAYESSPINVQRGLDTMAVLAAAHKSFGEKRMIDVEYVTL